LFIYGLFNVTFDTSDDVKGTAIYVKDLKKATKTLGQDKLCPGHDLKPGLPAHDHSVMGSCEQSNKPYWFDNTQQIS
jgi:hypothetical protein